MFLKWIYDVWFSDYDIPQNAITHACYKCKFTFSMDGRNDEEFKFPKMNQKFMIYWQNLKTLEKIQKMKVLMIMMIIP